MSSVCEPSTLASTVGVNMETKQRRRHPRTPSEPAEVTPLHPDTGVAEEAPEIGSAAPPAMAAKVAAANVANSGWEVRVDAEGRTYYADHTTKVWLRTLL